MNCRNHTNRRPMQPMMQQPLQTEPAAAELTAGNLKTLPLAMGYVPVQKYTETYELSTGLEKGTIFPELWKPFCGKGGGCGC